MDGVYWTTHCRLVTGAIHAHGGIPPLPRRTTITPKRKIYVLQTPHLTPSKILPPKACRPPFPPSGCRFGNQPLPPSPGAGKIDKPAPPPRRNILPILGPPADTHGQGGRGECTPPVGQKQVPSPVTEKWVPITKKNMVFSMVYPGL